MSPYKSFALTVALAGCTPHLPAADLDAAQKASDEVCACTHKPIDTWRECSAAALPAWQAADQKLRKVAPLDKLEPHSKQTLEAIEIATAKCRSMGEVVWKNWKPLEDAKQQGATVAPNGPGVVPAAPPTTPATTPPPTGTQK